MTAEEIFDKHQIMTMAFNKPKVLAAMKEYATEQIKKDRERILEQLNGIISGQDLWFLKAEFDQPVSLE